MTFELVTVIEILLYDINYVLRQNNLRHIELFDISTINASS